MSEWKPDIALLARFDDAEWLAVEKHFCGRLMAFVARRVRDVQAREDIVQDAFLGAVRGIEGFDPAYTFEQYLFGICKNRTIDHLRRKKALTLGAPDDSADEPGRTLEDLAVDDETPSGIVRQKDLEETGTRMLQELLRAWVEETWKQNEFVRLMVVEALFSAGWRNRDTWQRFELRDETAVAGIKFRALKRLRDLAQERDAEQRVLPLLSAAVDAGEGFHIDVRQAWRDGRVSCPARHWIARSLSGALEAGPKNFLAFHIDEVGCEYCRANLDDLSRLENSAEIEAVVARLSASTLQLLHSKTRPS
ncbi:MAG: sigma-70 family RNA polymerase sigma factor [Planctomycetes bacterium]|nr:sigma-70 family RNA polymerase sigma factor [Planctomycetota bacterium]